jgi:hypothetical protein
MDVKTQEKTPQEQRTYDFDWTEFPEFVDVPGTTIASVTSRTVLPTADATDLTLGSNLISGAHVQFPVSGGVAGRSYMIHVLVLTSGGSTLSGFGYLYVSSPTEPDN